MYKFLTYMSVFIPLYAALLTMNQYLTGKPTGGWTIVIFLFVGYILSTRLANIIDKADQPKP